MVLDLVIELCKTLAVQKIDYCHWKSNAFLDRSASGENDLDLLVNRNHAQIFTQTLYSFGFKEMLLPNEELPGVRNYYGYDQKIGKWIHVHAHFQLILGNDLSKNYRLPIEQAYLASSKQEDLFRVPAPEFELVVLVIRMVIKHSTWDSILMRHGKLSFTEKKELENLSTKETLFKVENVLLHHLPAIKKDLFELCLRSLQSDCPYRTRVKAGEQLQKALRTCARNLQWLDIVMKFFRRFQMPIQLHMFQHAPKNRFANGGLFVAVVGGDGSGKTTIINELYGWLSQKCEVKKLHLGKPAWSRATIFCRAILKVGTFLRFYSFEGDVYEESQQLHGFPWFIRTVCTARDRYLTYIQARRFSTNGGLVLCDRYPLPGFMNMDGPQCESALAHSKSENRLLKFLTHRENSYYQQIQLPDLLIVLKVGPEVTIRRKAVETAASVRARTTEVWNLDWKKLSAFEIDANQSKEEVLSQVRMIIWEHL